MCHGHLSPGKAQGWTRRFSERSSRISESPTCLVKRYANMLQVITETFQTACRVRRGKMYLFVQENVSDLN